MHPRTRELLDHLAAQRALLRRTIDDIPAALHAVRPAPDRWSIAEVVEHLGIMESRVVAMIRKHLDAACAAGLREETETSSVLGSPAFERLVDRTRKIVAAEFVRPTSTVELETTGDTTSLSV